MARAFLSSGDIVADRRASYAEMLFEGGNPAEAADVMRQAVEIVPEWPAGRFRLGEMQDAAGDAAGAASTWRKLLDIDPADHFGVSLRLAAAGLGTPPKEPPAAYVETLFDAYAASFEQSLLQKLEYRVPELLSAALETVAPGPPFGSVLDLGCGTGLMAPYLRPRSKYLVGVDLSSAMLQKAADKQLYDELVKADANEFASHAAVYDLIVAADVFVYVGDLSRVFANASTQLKLSGLFAFTVETYAGDEDMILQTSLRYTHSEHYVRRLLDREGMVPLALTRETIRLDRGEPLTGLVVVAGKAGHVR